VYAGSTVQFGTCSVPKSHCRRQAACCSEVTG
jgi:hypothetical protein